MADSQDAPPAPEPSPKSLEPQSAIADVFNSVTNWSLETLGQSSPRRGAGDNPFARGGAQPLSEWSLSGPLLEPTTHTEPTSASAAPPPPAPPPPNYAEIYSAHQKSYDPAGKDNLFVDPASLALAVRGAPALEAPRSNVSSISAASYAKTNLMTGDKSVAPAAPVSAPGTLVAGDAIANAAAAIYPSPDRAPADKKLTAAWRKLWRY